MKKEFKIKILPIVISGYFLVGVCLLLAGFFIFDHLGARSLWLDEANAANVIADSFSKLHKQSLVDGLPLFYSYLLKIWSLVFGESEFALRSFSALWCLVLIPLIYQVGADVFKNKKIGLLAAFLTAVNYFTIWFATQNKAYTLAALIGLASYYFLIKAAREQNRTNYVLYGFFGILGLYVHSWLLLIFASQVFSSFVFRKRVRNFAKIFLTQAIIAVFALPIIFIALFIGQKGACAWLEKPGFSAVFESFKFFSFGSSWPYLLISLLALFLIFWRRFRREAPQGTRDDQLNFAYFALCLYLFFPLLSALAISQYQPIYVVGRYEATVVPAFILILANLWSKIRNKFFWCFAVLILIFFTAKNVATERKFVGEFKSTDKTVARDLLRRMQDHDTVITTDLSYATLYYYLNHLNENQRKKFYLISFPEEIANHPSWKDMDQMVRDEPKYQKEADDLVFKLKNSRHKSGTIWVLYKIGNPINEILYEKFAAGFVLKKVEQPPLPREASWFDVILVFNYRD